MARANTRPRSRRCATKIRIGRGRGASWRQALAQLGRLEEARRETEMFLLSSPHFTISRWLSAQPFREDGKAVRDHFIDGYRKAGLPE